ncbi:MAG: hypothetical protein LBQ84_09030 [Flavobacteriaceae bacterium]|jgi:hypothetical protein|nr:hypothetical protein [Flavobacteriaceae bacterium]
MIKDGFLENIIDIFQHHEKFEYVDFKIDIHQDTLKIVYLIEPKFRITFQDKDHFKEKKGSDKFNILGEVVPGKFSLHENFLLTQKDEVYTKIKSWLDIIWREISLASPLGLLEEEQEHIDKICEKFDSHEGYFSTEEILEIKRELKILIKALKEEIMSIVEDEKIQKEEIEKLYNHFETLELLLPSLKKKGWIRSLTGRVFHNTRRLLDLRQKNILNNFNPPEKEDS